MGRIKVAIKAIKLGQFQSQRQAAAVYDVPRETLRDQINGSRPRRDYEVNLKKLLNHEEDIISEHILDRVSRGYPPKLAKVRDIADNILTRRDSKPIGKY